VIEFFVFPRLERRHVVQIGGREQHIVIQRHVIGGSQFARQCVVAHAVRVAPGRILEVLGREFANRCVPIGSGGRCGDRCGGQRGHGHAAASDDDHHEQRA
jgi:hypothetical protein